MRKKITLKQDHAFTKSIKHTQSNKTTGLFSEVLRWKNYRFTSYKVGIDTKNNREKINQNLRNYLQTLKKKKKNCENLGSLQFWSFSQMRINIGSTIRGGAAAVIQPVDSRVNDFICKQIRKAWI